MTHLKTFIKSCARCGFWMATFVVLFLNLRLYTTSPLADRDVNKVPPDLVSQLKANRAALSSGCAPRMQEFFPEGYYFSYLFHGLTWVELGMRDESFAPQAIEEAIWCLSFLNSPEGRKPFPRDLPPDHGMFYAAWKCSLRAGLVRLQDATDEQQLALFRQECDEIEAALQQSPTPFLASYRRAAWPCDTVPAIHALTAYDRITEERRYQTTIQSWLEAARKRLDSETGLLPHTASLPEGKNVGVARATSQVIMLRFLPDIDAPFAKQQYEGFRERFVTTFVGAPCVLEYPSGVVGQGDVDSGPLIFGRSLSGTVMMMAIAQIYGDQSLADAIAQAGETVGLPWTSSGKKQYVGGVLPIGDIIVAYAHVARPWFVQQQHHPQTKHIVPWYWRWQIHAWSLLLLLPATIRLIRRATRSRTNNQNPNQNQHAGAAIGSTQDAKCAEGPTADVDATRLP